MTCSMHRRRVAALCRAKGGAIRYTDTFQDFCHLSVFSYICIYITIYLYNVCSKYYGTHNLQNVFRNIAKHVSWFLK